MRTETSAVPPELQVMMLCYGGTKGHAREETVMRIGTSAELSELQMLLLWYNDATTARLPDKSLAKCKPGTLVWVKEGYYITHLANDGKILYTYAADRATGRAASYLPPARDKLLRWKLENAGVPRSAETGLFDLSHPAAYSLIRTLPVYMRVEQSRLTLRIESIKDSRKGSRLATFTPLFHNIEEVKK